jgi:nucleoid-associated protein YgaU
MFLDDGTPVRAKLTLNISEYRKIGEQLNELRLESPDRTKYRVLKEGDSLWQMAFREYNDPKEWRTIARKNEIDFPRTIPYGTMLSVPPLEE